MIGRSEPMDTSESPYTFADASSSDALRALHAAIVDSSDDAIVSKTLNGVITSWNRGAEKLFGYSAAEAIGRHITLIIPRERWAEEDDVLARLRRGERIDHFETIRRAKDGRELHISLTVSPVRDTSGTIIGASKVARDITDRIRAEEALERQRIEEERVRLLTRLVLAQEDERRRIARELHDQLGQQLTALRLTLEILKSQSVGRPELRVQVETLEELALQLDKDIAFRVWELRSSEIERRGLEQTLTDYVRSWSQHFDIRVQRHVSPSPLDRLPLELETTVYRLAQEALNNIAKHARADHVDVVLEHTAGHLSLIVEDNGVGFDPRIIETSDGGLGLIGMRERTALVGGEVQIESTVGRGTTILVRVPIAVAAIEKARCP